MKPVTVLKQPVAFTMDALKAFDEAASSSSRTESGMYTDESHELALAVSPCRSGWVRRTVASDVRMSGPGNKAGSCRSQRDGGMGAPALFPQHQQRLQLWCMYRGRNAGLRLIRTSWVQGRSVPMCGLWSRSWRRSTWCTARTRFVAEGRGQDFADLVDELLSGTSQGVLRRRCQPSWDSLKPTALP
jgi:hypothetical protein